jgi:hypothetical protein
MKKLIIFIIIFLFSLNLFGYEKMYWEKAQEEEDKVVLQLTYDISDFILAHKKELRKQGHDTDDICWTTYNRIYPRTNSSYPVKLKAGQTYIAFTYTTGERIKACWVKDSSQCYSEMKRGNKIIYYFAPGSSGNYHYLVGSNGEDTGIHVSYIVRLIK